MLRIQLNGQDLELYENQPIPLSLQYSTLSDLASPRSDFTQIFRVPLTPNNATIFGPLADPAAVATFDLQRRISAQILEDSVPLLTGYAQVKRAIVTGGKTHEVEVVIYGQSLDLMSAIGEVELRDLDWTGLDFTLSVPNIQASWNLTLSGGDVVMGVVDRGQDWSGPETFTQGNALQPSDLTPFVRVKTVVDAIMAHAGYDYKSSWLNGQTDLYLMATPGGRTMAFDTDILDRRFHVGLAVTKTIQGNTWQVLDFAESAPFYDHSNDVVSGVFTAPFDGLYTFRFRWWFFSKGTNSNSEIHIAGFVNGNEAVQIYEQPIANVIVGIQYATTIANVALTAGQTFDIRAHTHDNGSNDLVRLLGGSSLFTETTSLELVEFLPGGGVVDISANMPDMKARDFLLGLKSAFNLLFIPDPAAAPNMFIEPFSVYMNGPSTTRDWSSKIDTSKDYTIATTAEQQRRKYTFTHSPGEDIVNVAVQEGLERVFGRYEIRDTGNDFARGEQVIETGFAPFVLSYIPDAEFAIHRLLRDTTDDDKVVRNPKPRLAYYNGLRTSGTYYLSTTQLTKFPVFSQWTDAPDSLQPDDYDLSFGPERQFIDFTGNPNNTLYEAYHRQNVEQVYGPDARTLTATFRLTPTDIRTLKWRDPIYLFNTLWRAVEIKYNGNDPEGLATVKLLKILGESRGCAYVPNLFYRDGQVQFESPTGSSVTQVPEQCCLKYGHTYNNGTAECFTQRAIP